MALGETQGAGEGWDGCGLDTAGARGPMGRSAVAFGTVPFPMAGIQLCHRLRVAVVPSPPPPAVWAQWDPVANLPPSHSLLIPFSLPLCWVGLFFFLIYFFFCSMSYMATFCLGDLMFGSRPGDAGWDESSCGCLA